MAKKSWTEKRDGSISHKVKECTNGFADIKPGQMMLLPSAKQIDGYIRDIPQGQSRDLKTMRISLAQDCGAEIACPVVSGIHLRIIAEAAHADLEAGIPIADITPFWRMIGPKTPTLKKLSFDTDYILLQREMEGLTD